MYNYLGIKALPTNIALSWTAEQFPIHQQEQSSKIFVLYLVLGAGFRRIYTRPRGRTNHPKTLHIRHPLG